MENNNDYRGDITGMSLRLNETKPNYRCSFTHDGVTETLNIDDNNELLYNDQPVVTLEDHKKVLTLLLKGICGFV